MFQWDWSRILHGASITGEMTAAGDGIEGRSKTPQSCFRGGEPVSSEPFSEPLRLLLKEVMTSFERLEVLLFLRKSEPEAFTASAIGKSLHIQAELAAEAVEGLAEQGLLIRAPEADAVSFRFAPRTPALQAVAEELATAYRDHSAAVLSTMSINAIERIRSGPMRAFADSFVFGKRRSDG
jgi:hypothetical protein